MSWLSLYIIAGIVCAEGYLVGCKRLKFEPTRYEYALGVVLWPLTLLAMMFGAGRRS